MKKRLLLASGSAGRKQLLTDSLIPFEVIDQTADESQCLLNGSLQQAVQDLAQLKMSHVILPKDIERDQELFILTADTLTLGVDGSFLGKPTSRDHAVEMIRNHQGRLMVTGTGFCLEKRTCLDGIWTTQKRILGYAEGGCFFEVSDQDLDFYLAHVPFLTLSGAASIRSFGQQFVKEIRGSYSAIVGLPMFEIRQSLEEVGFL
jgi:septum formation protein